MSHVEPEQVACPACGRVEELPVFRSLNAEFIPHQTREILEGRFERIECPACGAAFQPEHRMLYVHFALRAWIVMHPPADQPRYAAHEQAVAALFAERFGEAPPVLRRGLAGARPRLVYGQRFLAEAVRVAESGWDAPVIECVKLLAVRRLLDRLFPHLPVELCFEGRAEDGALQLSVLDGADLTRLDTLRIPAHTADEVLATLPEFERRYPDLFHRPYVSATRYLSGPLPRDASLRARGGSS